MRKQISKSRCLLAKSMRSPRLAFQLVLLASVLLAGFQNCGNLSSNGFMPNNSLGGRETIQSEKHGPEFFKYPYLATPTIYAELQGVPLADSGSFHNLKVVAAAALADGTQGSLQYTVEVKDADGVALCPQYSGTLQPSYTTINYTCVTRQALSRARLHLVVTNGASSVTVDRQM